MDTFGSGPPGENRASSLRLSELHEAIRESRQTRAITARRKHLGTPREIFHVRLHESRAREAPTQIGLPEISPVSSWRVDTPVLRPDSNEKHRDSDTKRTLRSRKRPKISPEIRSNSDASTTSPFSRDVLKRRNLSSRRKFSA